MTSLIHFMGGVAAWSAVFGFEGLYDPENKRLVNSALQYRPAGRRGVTAAIEMQASIDRYWTQAGGKHL
jgi:hypothetical protein